MIRTSLSSANERAVQFSLSLTISNTHSVFHRVNPVCHRTYPSEDRTRLPLNLISALYSGCLAESVCIYFKQPESVVYLFFSPPSFLKLLLWDFPSLVYIFRFYKEQILSLKLSYFDWWGFGKGAGLCGLIYINRAGALGEYIMYIGCMFGRETRQWECQSTRLHEENTTLV